MDEANPSPLRLQHRFNNPGEAQQAVKLVGIIMLCHSIPVVVGPRNQMAVPRMVAQVVAVLDLLVPIPAAPTLHVAVALVEEAHLRLTEADIQWSIKLILDKVSQTTIAPINQVVRTTTYRRQRV
jgi:hypothetical protein